MSDFIDTGDFIDSQIAALYQQTYYGSLYGSSVASKIIATDVPTEAKPELSLTYGEELISAWREFGVTSFELRDGRSEPRLSAVAGDFRYPPRQRAEAICQYHAHEAPWPSCQCGFWALPTQEDARRYSHAPQVVGEVALWGRVLAFERGYRAQYAYPQRLFVYGTDDKHEQLRADLERIYGVPTYGVELKKPLKAREMSAKIVSFKIDTDGLKVTFEAMGASILNLQEAAMKSGAFADALAASALVQPGVSDVAAINRAQAFDRIVKFPDLGFHSALGVDAEEELP